MIVGLVLAVLLWVGLNFAYQLVRKPSELFFPVSGVLDKTPYQTWRDYGHLFRDHSTTIVTPDLLAALAQVEGSGTPLARPSWRWALHRRPFSV